MKLRSTKTLVKILLFFCAILIFFSIKMLVDTVNSHRRFDLRVIQGSLAHSKDKEELSVLATAKPDLERHAFSHREPKHFFLKEPDSMTSFISKTDNATCLNIGTRTKTDHQCNCSEGWLSMSCNIPESLYYSTSMNPEEKAGLRLRSGTARRVIYAALFNHEFVMLETLLNELYDLVDVFIFLESTFTAFGARKPLRLLPRLHRGYLRKFASKILYLNLDHFPTGARKKDSWIADTYLRGYLARVGLNYIHNLGDEDVFLVFDIDEIPKRDYVAFLKFHDGFPEPFGLRLRWSIFGFFWKYQGPTEISAGCTIRMLKEVFNNDSNLIRATQIGLNSAAMPNLVTYKKRHAVRAWYMGEDQFLAGWHCSSCMTPEDLRIKFMSAQNADYPRWGNIPAKMELTYLRNMVKEGKWFDGSSLPLADKKSDWFFAPQYILDNFSRYKYILVNPYV